MHPFEILQVLGMWAHSEAVSAISPPRGGTGRMGDVYRTIGSVFPDLGQPSVRISTWQVCKRFAGTEFVRLEVCQGLFKTFVEDSSL